MLCLSIIAILINKSSSVIAVNGSSQYFFSSQIIHFFFNFILFIYWMCEGIHGKAHVWRSEDTFQKSVLFFHYMCPRERLSSSSLTAVTFIHLLAWQCTSFFFFYIIYSLYIPTPAPHPHHLPVPHTHHHSPILLWEVGGLLDTTPSWHLKSLQV